MTKALFRQYDHGEVVAVLPNVSGDPEGKMCIAYAAVSGFYPVDLDTVISNTTPASETKSKRLKKELTAAQEIEHLTVLPKKPAKTQEVRSADKEAFKSFDQVARLHAFR